MTQRAAMACRALAVAGLLALAGCAGVSGTSSTTLPDATIVNDPRSPPEVVDTPPLPVPELSAPMHDELPAEPVHADLLERIRRRLALPDVDHPWVRAELAWFARNPDYLERCFGRGLRYLHFIANEVEARGMPAELALLPVVESAFNPFAYSRSHASGLWQFIAPTGELFGLRRNYWQDQRRDVVDATRAALDYLQVLYERFGGDWMLAIASYNWGAGNVQRAMARNYALGRGTDFFSLSMPAETRAYVPKLLALARIVRDPAAHGLTLTAIPDAPYFRVVPTAGAVDLRRMADLAGITTEELHALNPGWNRWLTDPQGPHRLLVPEVVADGFVNRFTAMDSNARAQLGTHTLAPGESIASIAGHFKVPESFLREINGTNGVEPETGTALLVPAGDVSPLRPGLGREFERSVHRVRSGDSLWSIARRHGMTVAQLARLNGISTSATLQPSQRLSVSGTAPAAAGTAAASGARSLQYTVRRGDTLSLIARRFAVTVRQLQAWNAMGSSTALRAGQRLTIRLDSSRNVGG